MSFQPNKVIIYKFQIQAISPAYFGGDKQGQLIKASDGNPILLGSSIGGALRDYLTQFEDTENQVIYYMGGNLENAFAESRIYISDASIEGISQRKEGTRINTAYGSAEDGHKYTLECLTKGSILIFTVECDTHNQKEEEEFKKIIGTWETGFRQNDIKLGGQQNNGFGQFKLIELSKKEFIFSDRNSLQNYIFNFDKVRFNQVKEDMLLQYKLCNKKQISFMLKGQFPYGVYQSFEYKGDSKKKLTGLQCCGDNYYIPASSFKGLVRNEVRLLLEKFITNDENNKRLNEKLEQIFGGKEQKGRLIFSDIVISDVKKVKVKRYNNDGTEKEKTEETLPVYNKIDRITGGTIDSALKTQIEIVGNATLQCQLYLNENEADLNHEYVLFPLIYVLRRIGNGSVPIGGRTTIGLGQFEGKELTLSGKAEEVYSTETLSDMQNRMLEKYYNSFKGWCYK